MKKILTMILILLVACTGCSKINVDTGSSQKIFRYSSADPQTGFIIELASDGDTIESLTYVRTFTRDMMKAKAKALELDFDTVSEEMYNMLFDEYKLINSTPLPDYSFYESSFKTFQVSKDVQTRYTFITSDEEFLKYVEDKDTIIWLVMAELGIDKSYSPETKRFSYKRLQNCYAWKQMNIDSEKEYNKKTEEELWN